MASLEQKPKRGRNDAPPDDIEAARERSEDTSGDEVGQQIQFENGFTGKVHHMDARVGGSHRMSFTNFTTGTTHSFGGEYLELVPH